MDIMDGKLKDLFDIQKEKARKLHEAIDKMVASRYQDKQLVVDFLAASDAAKDATIKVNERLRLKFEKEQL